MEKASARSALRQIQTLYTLGTLGGLTDSQLLDLFLTRGGDAAEAAFAALVDRHGPMVLSVCRRMLPRSHDAEDAFQAAFLILARRAASIGRREQLASWLYGVAIRTAKEARRRDVRDHAREVPLVDVPEADSASAERSADHLMLLDEELNRLPPRYRAALVACELEAKSRREAAQQLGLPEGTLSTHLARGRKLLRERLLRRGVNLEVGPLAELSRHVTGAAIPERLIGPTIRAALCYASGDGAAGTVPAAVASLVEKVLKMMFLSRLTVLVATVMAASAAVLSAAALGFATLAGGSPKPDPPNPGTGDLSRRVVNKAGAGVADVRVWAIGGRMYEPVMVATATTDGQGRFILPHAREHKAAEAAAGDDRLGLFARAPDGRVGWLTNFGNSQAADPQGDIELGPVGEVRGRVTDQDGRPIAGATIATEGLWKPTDAGFSDYIPLVAEAATTYRTTTVAEGSYVLEGIPQGALVDVTVTAKGFGTPRIAWNSTQAATIMLDSRVGRITGKLRPLDARGLSGEMSVYVHRAGSAGTAHRKSVSLRYNAGTKAGKDGSFRFDGLPPGRYSISASADNDAPFVAKPLEEFEIGPNAVVNVEIPLDRLVTITGRVVDAQTGNGIAGIPVGCYRLDNMFRKDPRYAQTDTDGRYSVMAQPGTVLIEPQGLPKTYLVASYSDCPNLEVNTGLAWPDLKLSHATALDGVVNDASGHPAAGAEVYLLAADRPGAPRRKEPIRTGRDGTFHFDQIDAGRKLSLWARAGGARTNGAVVIRPREVKGKLTLTIDPKSTVTIRGMATDSAGKRIAGAKVTLWWTRSYAAEDDRPMGGIGNVLTSYTTSENGWFVFRGLWPELRYEIVIEAKGHNKADAPQLLGKAGETHDVGKIVLINANGYLAGRVVGSDGLPIAGAAVFNRGDCAKPVATSTDARGAFRLEGMFPGTKYVFVRKDGYRFTGLKAGGDVDGMTITLLKTGEPPRAWKPGTSASYDEQRAFAKRALIRIWEKYGATNQGALRCIRDMAEIDPALALQWSAQHGHQYGNHLRQAQAVKMAETDPIAALALLNEKHDSNSQSTLQALADRFADTDLKKAMPFANEAAVRARVLNQPERTMALARAGAVLVKLGRADVGRKLLDEAARDAAQLPTANRAGSSRMEVARVLAPHDLMRALALIEPIQDAGAQRSHRFRARVAVAIATTNTKEAVALADAVGGPAFFHEQSRSAIAYKIGADRPDEAIKIIEGIKRNRWAPQWQAGAFGWLAVALARRDRARAYSLIDRALAMTIDNRDWMGPGDEMAVAARIALCARRIGYPGMESVIMRVLAARPSEPPYASSDRTRLIQRYTTAAVPLALIDPGAARTVLEQVEARSGLDPATLWNTRGPWLTAWALVDLEKAQSIFGAMLTALDGPKEVDLWNAGFYEMIELLAAPPARREEALGKSSHGGYWRPGQGP